MAASKSKKGVRSENVNALFKNISKQKTKINKNIDDELTKNKKDATDENYLSSETDKLNNIEESNRDNSSAAKKDNNDEKPNIELTKDQDIIFIDKELNQNLSEHSPKSGAIIPAVPNETSTITNSIINEVKSTLIDKDQVSKPDNNTESAEINSIVNPSNQEDDKYIEVITAKAGRPKKFTNGTFSISIRLPAELEPIFDIAIQRFQGNKTAYLTQLVVKDLMENQDNYKMMDEAVKKLETLRNTMFGNDKNLMNSINKTAIDWSELKLK